MNISGNNTISVNNTYRTESMKINSLKSESATLTNIKNVKNEPVLFKKNIISAETFDRIQQKAIDAKNARKHAIPVSDKSINALKNMGKVTINADLFDRIQQKAIDAKNARKS